MSCDFESKMVVSYIDGRSMNTEADREQKVSKQSKLNSLQCGYLRFSTLFALDPQNVKKNFFGKSAIKSIFFKKPYYMYRTYIRVVGMPNFKFVYKVLTPK